jgi:hypothetical protein
MSNFLNNLVARTLNLAPVVQPRINSRFEPVPPVPDQTVEVETPAPERHETTTKILETRVIEPKPVVEREQPHIDVQNVINTIRNTYVDKHEVVQVPVIEKVREHVQTETRIHTEKNTDSRLEIRENRILEPAREIEKKDLPNPRLDLAEPAPVTREVPVAIPIAPRVITRTEPAPPVQRFEIPPPPQPEPTETINVTIGRVDVRAVFSSQTPKTPARTASVNSLDDYLKQRSEGRR